MKIYLMFLHTDRWSNASEVLSVHETKEGAIVQVNKRAEEKYKKYLDSGAAEACLKRPVGYIGAWYQSEPLELEDFVSDYSIDEIDLLD